MTEELNLDFENKTFDVQIKSICTQFKWHSRRPQPY